MVGLGKQDRLEVGKGIGVIPPAEGTGQYWAGPSMETGLGPIPVKSYFQEPFCYRTQLSAGSAKVTTSGPPQGWLSHSHSHSTV